MEHSFTPPGIDRAAAERAAGILQDRLTGLIDLSMSLKHAHWNVSGRGFLAVHKMFDAHVAEVRSMVDDMAERIATLGGVPNGLPGFVESERYWADYALGRAPVSAHLGALDSIYDDRIIEHRASIGVIDPLDPITSDMLTTQTGRLEKQQWLIRAHLQDISGELPTDKAESQLDAAAAALAANS